MSQSLPSPIYIQIPKFSITYNQHNLAADMTPFNHFVGTGGISQRQRRSHNRFKSAFPDKVR